MADVLNRPWLWSALRTLRIVWTTALILASAVFAFFWIRSERRIDSVTLFNCVAVGAFTGTLNVSLHDPQYAKMDWWASTGSVEGQDFTGAVQGFGFARHPSYLIITAPFWFVVPLTLVLAAAPWMGRRWHFSLRIILITLSLVAVLFGLSAWLSRFPGISKSPFD